MLNGIVLRLLSVAFFAAMSATVHGLSHSVPVGQIVFWRSFVAIIPIVIYMAWIGRFPNGFLTKRPGGHLMRGLFGGTSMMLSFISLAYLPVANATALAFLGPLISLPVAAILLGEVLTRRIVWAALIGFAGVMLMLASSLVRSDADPGRLIGIAAGLGFAATMGLARVQIRTLTRTESAVTIAFWFSVISSLIGLLSLPFGWVPMAGEVLGYLLFAGLLGGVAQILATEAAARVPVSQLAPFDYTGMIWALGFDVILFRQFPDWISFVGMGAIVAAGIITVITPRADHPAAAPPAPRQPWH